LKKEINSILEFEFYKEVKQTSKKDDDEENKEDV